MYSRKFTQKLLDRKSKYSDDMFNSLYFFFQFLPQNMNVLMLLKHFGYFLLTLIHFSRLSIPFSFPPLSQTANTFNQVLVEFLVRFLIDERKLSDLTPQDVKLLF